MLPYIQPESTLPRVNCKAKVVAFWDKAVRNIIPAFGLAGR